MSPKKMSERLEAKRRQISPEKSPKLIRIYHKMHGNNKSNVLLAVIMVGGLYSVGFGNLDAEEALPSIILCLGYSRFILDSCFWLEKRMEVTKILSQMIDVARVLEQWSNARQSTRLMKISNATKFLADWYNSAGVAVVTLFMALPVITRKHGVKISIVPDSEFWFWIVYVVEGAYFISGMVAVYAMFTFHVQTTVCLFGLLENISDHFQKAENNNRLNDLIKRHQQLLVTCSKFRVLISRWAFIKTSTFLLIITINTFGAIRGNRDPRTLLTIPLCLMFVVIFCAFGQMLVTASEGIGWSAYRNDWLTANPDFRRKLVLVIERSQTPAFLEAGLVGSLTLPTFTGILRLWFQYVQALLNLM